MRPLVDAVPAYRRIAAAVMAARHSVWLTAAFFAPDFRMPDGGGALFDVLDRAVERGLDVRIIFWRPNQESIGYGRTFAGSTEQRAMLEARRSRFRIRWDRAFGPYCQHQKSWLVDAGESGETAFVGGMNLTARAMGSPGHRSEGERHDVYLEIRGPSATDVHHNFVQRWNEASERLSVDGSWGHSGDDGLSFPARLSTPRGKSIVQIQRMVHPGRYSDTHPSPQSSAYDIAGGERSVLAQYLQAIDAARRSIYIENQAIPIPQVAAALETALKRGVDVVALVPADPETHVRLGRQDPGRKPVFDGLAALGRYENFTLAGIAGLDAQDRRSNIYVHSKIMLVDDTWATIGSCNLHALSLSGHTEMNASIWDPEFVRALRCELLAEHLGHDTKTIDDRSALSLYRDIAGENRGRRDVNDSKWQGLAFSLNPAGYGA
ncbi:MAG TPA: phosphatidylserine/phosphatidylglycerophosphate/cardiolipin synthase family protein [Bradyrhizobium sp.]|nr:phosphatidylserine/phosphatidylglycerophosphate/cardiolipin synthase family protein [Bradyrhizobium sp.]